ncbi:unnamed protein product [Soboliphyme baturini]|uniref:Prefoldin subunit 4 n=1 Tax=Soboliphyme baturini TaxID=241478 RepID=A0A183IF44_9BILA|nr:unnamed protein product [Soboliphyme baturini]
MVFFLTTLVKFSVSDLTKGRMIRRSKFMDFSLVYNTILRIYLKQSLMESESCSCCLFAYSLVLHVLCPGQLVVVLLSLEVNYIETECFQANVMVEYSPDQAREFLKKELCSCNKRLEEVESSCQFLKDQLTITEVSILFTISGR